MEPSGKPTSLDLIWGAEAIATELGCDRRRAFYLCEKGEIPAKKVGGKWVVRRDELHAFFLKGDAA
jgi:excisionase family DNA binding protein